MDEKTEDEEPCDRPRRSLDAGVRAGLEAHTALSLLPERLVWRAGARGFFSAYGRALQLVDRVAVLGGGSWRPADGRTLTLGPPGTTGLLAIRFERLPGLPGGALSPARRKRE